MQIELLEKVGNYEYKSKEPINTIKKKDCIKHLSTTNLEFDLIIADPPYNIGKDFGNNSDNMNLSTYIDWSVEWIALCLEKLKENGIMYIYGFPEILSHIAVNYPINNQKWLVWHYTNKTVPSLKFWQRSHESILCLWKNKKPKLEIDQIREPYTESFKRNCAGKIRKSTKGRFSKGNKETIYNAHELGALPRDVIKVSALAGGKGMIERSPMKHPTQKPFELTRKLIKSRINGAGGLVYIPFCGSGSECMVSKALGIDFIATEINSNYVKGARDWLDDLNFLEKLSKNFQNS